MPIDRSVRIGIISSLIASCAFILLFEPILRWVGRFLFGGGRVVFGAYTDRLFEQAALLTPPDPSLFLYVFVMGGMASLAIGLLTSMIVARRSPRIPRVERASRFPIVVVILAGLFAVVAFGAILMSSLKSESFPVFGSI